MGRFFKFPLHILQFCNLLERFFKFPLLVQHFYLRNFPSFLSMFYISTTYLRGFLHFLSTILHPSIHQEIYISSPQFYIPPRNIGFLSTFLHSTTYNDQPTHPNSRNKTKNEAFNNQENLAKRRRKIQEPTFQKPLIIY